MNVLVTGASAPLGLALVDRLVAAHDVDAVLAVALEPLERTHPKLVAHGVDLLHARAMHDLVWGEARELEIDVVIHGMQHRATRDAGHRVHAQNVGTTRELVHSCQHHPTIRRLVYRSFAEVYGLDQTTTNLLDEDAPVSYQGNPPQWLRDRIEADQMLCGRSTGPLEIAVLRCAEILASDTGSQLWDYLQSRVCLRPLGFDPMINVLALEDAVTALVAAARATATGVFNIPGADTLPLSEAIAAFGRVDVPMPGPFMALLYDLRRRLAGFDFRYDLNLAKFHFGGVLDGSRAWRELGFAPSAPAPWPRPWWRRLFERLETERAW